MNKQFKTSLAATLLARVLVPLVTTLLVWVAPAQADTKIRVSSFEYAASGLLTKEVVEPDLANDCLQTSYTYDGYGNKTVVSATTCAGATGYTILSAATPRTSNVSFTADGRFPVTSTNALNQSESRLYDPRFGVLASLIGPNNLPTTWQYDNFGRKTRETRADATYTTWSYKRCADVGANCPGPIAGASISWVAIEQSYAVNNAVNSPEKRQFYDILNRVVRVQTQGFDGVSAAPTLVQDTEYNALGQIARQSNLYALTGTPVWTSYVYDALGRAVRESHSDSAASGGIATTTFSYNALTTTVTNPKGQTQTTTKNAQGQVSVVVDALGSTVSYSYDALGQLTQTNAAGSITTMTYNQRGQKASMTDPAMGAWAYYYNAFGELVSQRDSLNQSVTMTYDVLGRMTQRIEPDLTSQWFYDKKFDQTSCGTGVGKLCEATANNGYNRKHSYDTLGRLSSTTTVLDNVASPAVVSTSFDANTGRVVSKTWPTGYQASYAYSTLGYLTSVTGGGTNGFTQTVSYTVQAMNAQGQITQYRTGNQVTTVKAFDPLTQRLTGQTATLDGQSVGNMLNQSYTYDALSNLITRVDNTTGIGTQENFSYDSLNRLTTATILGGSVSPPTTTEVKYDARGNIAYKSDVGRYWYDAARPNRMTNVTLETVPGATQPVTGTRTLSYAFDDFNIGVQTVNGVTVGNGNLAYTVSHDPANNVHTVRYESYTSFNMPSQIVYGNFITSTTSTADRTLSFVYGPEHQRIKQNVALTGNGTSSYFGGNTWYLNGEDSQGLSFEKEIRDNGTTESKHYVSAGGVVFALFTSRTGSLPATSISYFQYDQLGSISAIANEAGAVTERMAYDPWGKRRFINSTPGMPDKLDAIVGLKTDRGFTMHEHLDEIGVIHMNGRIYDPLIGRFMSADPFIQAPGNLQSYNRYAYVMNNPLGLSDPSGYSWLSDIWHEIWHNEVVQAVVTIAITTYAGPEVGSAYSAARTWNDTGSLEQGLKAGVTSYVTTLAFVAVGDLGYGTGSAANIAAHAAVGCASSVASGGNCQSGALSAGFSEFASPFLRGGSFEMRVAQRAIIGGTASVLGGGKFENGAVTAAFGYLFNECGHTRACGSGFGAGDSYSGSDPLVDKSGRLVIGGDQKPVLMPMGTDMELFANAGRSPQLPADLLLDLKKFQYGSWDLQRQGNNFETRYIDAASVAIGVHAAAAGMSLNVSLSAQNFFARNSTYPPGTFMSPTYSNLPQRNVDNTTIGYNLVKKGGF